MFMKVSERTHALVAQVDVSNVRFDKGRDLGIEFRNQIDGWKKLELKFRQQIHELRSGKLNRGPSWEDLTPLHYSIREKLD
jgi:hypothetical protein